MGACGFQILQGLPSHIADMARCHGSCFPDQFMSRMGLRYTEAFYRRYLDEPKGVAFVAVDDRGTVIGLVVGGDGGIRSRFLRSAWWRHAPCFLIRFLTNSFIRRKVLAAVWSRPRGSGASDASNPPASDLSGAALLQVICVEEAWRGTPVATGLLEAFTDRCRKAGYAGIVLAVSAENERAIRFYARNQWSILRRTPPSVWMQRTL